MIEVKKVGFVGLGIMGKPMARNLLKAGFELNVHSRSRPPVDELVSEGATAADSPSACASGMDAIVTMLPDSPDSEAVILDREGNQTINPGSVDGHLTGTRFPGVQRIDAVLEEVENDLLDQDGIAFNLNIRRR